MRIASPPCRSGSPQGASRQETVRDAKIGSIHGTATAADEPRDRLRQHTPAWSLRASRLPEVGMDEAMGADSRPDRLASSPELVLPLRQAQFVPAVPLRRLERPTAHQLPGGKGLNHNRRSQVQVGTWAVAQRKAASHYAGPSGLPAPRFQTEAKNRDEAQGCSGRSPHHRYDADAPATVALTEIHLTKTRHSANRSGAVHPDRRGVVTVQVCTRWQASQLNTPPIVHPCEQWSLVP